MRIEYTDVLVVGGGLAGLRTAVGVARRGLRVEVLSLVPAKRSHSVAAQGGMQASLGNAIKGCGDNEDVHFEDTVRGSDWGCDQLVARMFAHMAPKAVRELAAWGVPWNRVQRGAHEVVISGERVTLVERDEAHGLITARDFGGTRKWRTCYTADGTGHTMLYALGDRAVAEGIPVRNRSEAVALIHDGGRCQGAVVRDLETGELYAILAAATVVATGGFGRIWGISTNAIINEGMGAAIALETGVARLANMEAVQFHPTAIVPAGILVTEGCRGDGGLLRDVDGHRFMPDYEPEKAELASRDVVSRRMAEHMRRGKGVQSAAGEHLWLDIAVLGAAHIDHKLREVKDICRHFLGIDPARDWIPVRPTQHYSMGGIRTDHRGESPSLRGLFAVGEAACWDLHGFNRLGGNSLAETVVAGMLVGEYVADFVESHAGALQFSPGLAREFVGRERAALEAIAARPAPAPGGDTVASLRREMEATMTEHVGLFRNEAGLRTALGTLADLHARAQRVGIASRHLDANPELVAAYRLSRMLALALCAAQGALERRESRGAHAREDYPARNDRDWLRRTLAWWPAGAVAPVLEYESITVEHMELAPGFRGYGTRNIVDHPATALREAEIASVRVRLDGAGRASVQAALLDFRACLPERYRGDNERLADSEEGAPR